MVSKLLNITLNKRSVLSSKKTKIISLSILVLQILKLNMLLCNIPRCKQFFSFRSIPLSHQPNINLFKFVLFSPYKIFTNNRQFYTLESRSLILICIIILRSLFGTTNRCWCFITYIIVLYFWTFYMKLLLFLFI